MAKVRNIALPAELNEALVRILFTVPEEILADLGKSCLPGGFVHGKDVRERLIAKIRGPGSLDNWLINFLATGLPGRAAISALSVDGATTLAGSLGTLAGRWQVVLAMVFDPRPEIQRLGGTLLAKGLEQPPESEREAAKKALCEFMDRHFLCLAGVSSAGNDAQSKPALPGASEESRPVSQPEMDELMAKVNNTTVLIERQDKTITQLRNGIQEQARKSKLKLEAESKRAAEEKRRLVQERDQARVQVHRAAKDKDALNKRVAELTTSLEEQAGRQQTEVAQAVEQQTSALVRKWLAAPQQAEQHLEKLTGTSADLLDRAEKALEAQAQQDRFTGNRLELEQQLARLTDARERLTRAAQHAICPLPQMKTLLAEVEEEIAQVQRVLTNRRPAEPFADRLLVGINECGTNAEAKRHSELLEQLIDLDLLPRDTRRRLFDALQRKFSLLEEQRDAGAPDNGWSLRDALFRNRRSLILLDGHNILFGLEDVFRADYDERGYPGRKAREHLVRIVSRLGQGRENVRARICFDAPQHGLVSVTDNVEIEYSGGTGAHRADERIRSQLTWKRPETLDHKWFVVSDDRQVRRQAAKHGAQFVPVDLFAVLLADFQCLSERVEQAA